MSADSRSAQKWKGMVIGMDKKEAAQKLMSIFGNVDAIAVLHSVLVGISKYIIIVVFAVYTWHCFTVFIGKNMERKEEIYRRQKKIMFTIHFICSLVLFLNSLSIKIVLFYVAQVVFLVLVDKAYSYVYQNLSKLVMNNMLMLLTIGFLMIERLNMDFAMRQMIFASVICVAGLFIPWMIEKEVYAQLVPEEEPELLSNIVRIFKDIPENSTIDIFGEIYEYFLGNFALAEGKDGGTFYTPATVVRYMVEILNPQPGEKKFLDPACGSGGMFVQAARYMHNHNANESEQMKFRCYGVEKEPDTVKLAKMNLLLNNVRGDITEANSFYSDPYNAFGQFDYVMANPPFNVDEVVVDRVSEDTRFNTYGVPRNKSKSTKKKSDKKETVPNANYLWIGYFATALNEHGKAALVMANSASDASGSEYDIRKKMIEEGIISQMVTLPSNMFSSVTLPATLWFFDKQKPNTDKKNEILFIDARNVFTQVDRAHRKFSDEQIKNLGVITKLYHGDTQALVDLIDEYKAELANAPESSDDKEILTKAYWQSQIDWLTERFPDGVYADVIGLCKAAPMDGEDGIIDQDYSLNAGRYVGVVIEDDGLTQEEFKEEMNSLNAEFTALSAEAKSLEELIASNLKGLLGE